MEGRDVCNSNPILRQKAQVLGSLQSLPVQHASILLTSQMFKLVIGFPQAFCLKHSECCCGPN